MKPDKVGDEEVDMPAYSVSYKPQELIPKISTTVRELLHKKIPGSFSNAQFRSDVMKPLKIEELMDRQVGNFSGGELQRVALCLCLGKVKTQLITPYVLSLRIRPYCWYRNSLGLHPETFSFWGTPRLLK